MTLIEKDPSLLAVDLMYCIFSTPLICSSKGVTTERITVSLFPPGYEPLTITVGGEISGNRVTDNRVRPITPSITSTIEITVANTGLSIIFFNMEMLFY
ncbi:hypothetical protein D3C87_952820 [compost metagenome]